MKTWQKNYFFEIFNHIIEWEGIFIFLVSVHLLSLGQIHFLVKIFILAIPCVSYSCFSNYKYSGGQFTCPDNKTRVQVRGTINWWRGRGGINEKSCSFLYYLWSVCYIQNVFTNTYIDPSCQTFSNFTYSYRVADYTQSILKKFSSLFDYICAPMYYEGIIILKIEKTWTEEEWKNWRKNTRLFSINGNKAY